MTSTSPFAAERRLLLALAVLTALTYASGWVLPRGEALFTIPDWVTPLTIAFTLVTAVLMLRPTSHRRAVFRFGCVAVVGMLWAAGGVLMDVLSILDGLGVLDLPQSGPDYPAIATRACSLITAIVLIRVLAHHQRHTRGVCLHCGQDGTPVRQRRWLGYAGLLLGLPYPLLKTHWALGGTIGLDYPDLARDGFTRGWLVAPAAIIGLVLSLALVHRWGRIWPRWVPGLAGRRTPRRLLLFGGWFGSGVLLTMGMGSVTFIVTGLITGNPAPTAGGMHAWPGYLFYVSWLLWGLVLAPATWLYQARTRPCCTNCGRVPA